MEDSRNERSRAIFSEQTISYWYRCARVSFSKTINTQESKLKSKVVLVLVKYISFLALYFENIALPLFIST